VKNIETKKDLLREWRQVEFTSTPAAFEKEEEKKIMNKMLYSGELYV
jgi:hypothetical protein